MRNYKLIYLNALNLSTGDFIASELSGKRAVDIHHILCKGSGGNPTGELNRIENLMAVTREEHLNFGDKKQHISFLFRRHQTFLEANGVRYSKKWMQEQIEKYEVYETETSNI